MMEALREWLTSLVAVTLLFSVARQLMGEGSIGKIGSFVGGLLLLVVVLDPLPGLDMEKLAPSMEAYTQAVEAELETLESANRGEWAGLIESRTAAYISEQADRMGTPVTVRVRTELSQGGVPVPSGVELTGERTQALTVWLETELGIPEERQVWNHED